MKKISLLATKFQTKYADYNQWVLEQAEREEKELEDRDEFAKEFGYHGGSKEDLTTAEIKLLKMLVQKWIDSIENVQARHKGYDLMLKLENLEE